LGWDFIVIDALVCGTLIMHTTGATYFLGWDFIVIDALVCGTLIMHPTGCILVAIQVVLFL
jgi:ribosomal protein S27E